MHARLGHCIFVGYDANTGHIFAGLRTVLVETVRERYGNGKLCDISPPPDISRPCPLMISVPTSLILPPHELLPSHSLPIPLSAHLFPTPCPTLTLFCPFRMVAVGPLAYHPMPNSKIYSPIPHLHYGMVSWFSVYASRDVSYDLVFLHFRIFL